jgi:hypothetical protein
MIFVGVSVYPAIAVKTITNTKITKEENLEENLCKTLIDISNNYMLRELLNQYNEELSNKITKSDNRLICIILQNQFFRCLNLSKFFLDLRDSLPQELHNSYLYKTLDVLAWVYFGRAAYISFLYYIFDCPTCGTIS